MKHPAARGFAIYSRKSKFTGRGESIKNQIELCRQRLRSMEVPEGQIVVFEDEGFSGGNTQRPQFQAMMRDNFDTTTPTGRAMMLMSSVFAQLERETQIHKTESQHCKDCGAIFCGNLRYACPNRT